MAHRFRPSMLRIKKIRLSSKTRGLVIPRRSFLRLIQGISKKMFSKHTRRTTGPRFQSATLMALQEAAEAFVINWMEDMVLMSVNMSLVWRFRAFRRGVLG